LPEVRLTKSSDSFGNAVYSGFIAEPHTSFEYESSGEAELSAAYLLFEPLNRRYLYQSEYTAMNGQLHDLLRRITPSGNMSVDERVWLLSVAVHNSLLYAPESTNVNTTAGEALALGCGVCQDYAHLLLALCRAVGVPARYVAGFYEGEKYTHAWVEYYNDGVWKAIDPTNNRTIETGYVKLAHGRDYADCSIERGVFTGIVQQQMKVSLNVSTTTNNP